MIQLVIDSFYTEIVAKQTVKGIETELKQQLVIKMESLIGNAFTFTDGSDTETAELSIPFKYDATKDTVVLLRKPDRLAELYLPAGGVEGSIGTISFRLHKPSGTVMHKYIWDIIRGKEYEVLEHGGLGMHVQIKADRIQHAAK